MLFELLGALISGGSIRKAFVMFLDKDVVIAQTLMNLR